LNISRLVKKQFATFYRRRAKLTISFLLT